jgi:hypothetical protein
MSSHLLLRRSFRFPPHQDLSIEGWTYNRDLGAWVTEEAPHRLMVSVMKDPRPNPKPQPVPPPMSKKADMETGEDMKGT